MPMFQFQFSENSIPRSHSFPLFPIDCSNSTPCPFIRCFEKSFHICKSKVFHPASHILLVFPFSFCIANAFVPISKLSDFISHLDYRLLMYSKSASAFVSIKTITEILLMKKNLRKRCLEISFCLIKKE